MLHTEKKCKQYATATLAAKTLFLSSLSTIPAALIYHTAKRLKLAHEKVVRFFTTIIISGVQRTQKKGKCNS